MKKDLKVKSCPADAFQKMINGKYKLRIIWGLQEGPMRNSEIKKGLLRGAVGTPEIPARVLSRELKALVEAGLVIRKDFKLVPPKVEYRLTSTGKSLIPVIATIHSWGMRHLV